MNLFVIITDYLIPFILALGVLIFFHELGHYAVARWFDVKVKRFAIGFGRPLLSWTVGPDRTEWSLRAVPLGGYVMMLDENEGEVAEEEKHRAFNAKPAWQRFAIVAAGPIANFLLAIVLYWGLFVIGTEELKPRLDVTEAHSVAARAGVREGDLALSVNGEEVRSWTEFRWVILRLALDQKQATVEVRTRDNTTDFRTFDFSGVRLDDAEDDIIALVGLRPWRAPIPAVIGDIQPGSAAAKAGMQVGDRIVELSGEAVNDWAGLVGIVQKNPGRQLDAVVLRSGSRHAMTIVPDSATDNGATVGRIGVLVAEPVEQRAEMFGLVRYGVFESFGKSVSRTWEMSVLSLKMIGRMITGHVSVKNISGPVTIANFAGQSARMGWTYFLGFLAVISIGLGIMNLLPIPMLDGGHLLYYSVEIVKGSPLPERVIAVGQQIGLALLAILMALAFVNDLARIFAG